MNEWIPAKRFTYIDMVRMLWHLPTLVRLLFRLVFDTRVMPLAKVMFVASALFILSPLDVPNFVPVLGEMSDIALALLVCNWFVNCCPRGVVGAHLAAIRGQRPGFSEPGEAQIVDLTGGPRTKP